jgi:hypothetical protein
LAISWPASLPLSKRDLLGGIVLLVVSLGATLLFRQTGALMLLVAAMVAGVMAIVLLLQVVSGLQRARLWVENGEVRCDREAIEPITGLRPTSRVVVRARNRPGRTSDFELVAIDARGTKTNLAEFVGDASLPYAMYVRQCIQDVVGIEDRPPDRRPHNRTKTVG